MMSRRQLVLLCACALLLVCDACAWAVQYRIRDLSIPGAIDSSASDINDLGQVVGSYSAASGTTRSFLWQNGSVRDIGTLGGYAVAQAINEKGQVAGTSVPASEEPWNNHGFVWQDGSMQDLGTLDGHWSAAFDINETGEIAGLSAVEPANWSWACHAIVWQGNSILDVSGGFRSRAYALNDAGQVVGQGGANGHAYLWDDGLIIDLSTLGGSESAAWAINGSGQVVGDSWRAGNGSYHAFLWQGGSMTDLGTLLGGSYSRAYGINEAGLVVGYSNTADDPSHAFLWQNGSMQDLGTLGGTWSEASAINASGVIAGYSTDASGVRHAVLWEPVPEASSLLGLASGLALVPMVRRGYRVQTWCSGTAV